MLDRLIAIAKAGGGHTKIDNAPGHFMAACVEIIGKVDGHNDLVSVAHYGEQNGDAMRDPDIVFEVSEIHAWPISYRNDYMGINNEAVEYDENGMFHGCRRKMQADITDCANMLLRNIAAQQGI
ncbi:MAG TPA: hypothetical protein DCZ95_01240 [Verrucomicrobia bacterium]|nr:hypothetical protein [Verrucomicrobiota bacterium]